MINNIITAQLKKGEEVRTVPVWQYDYGMILLPVGIALPDAYEVHFANDRKGDSVTSIGNASGVVIPDSVFLSGKNVRAYVYLHSGEDDGETVYNIIIPVNDRAKPTNETPTPVQQDVITQTIAALNVAVEKSESNVLKYPKIVDGYWYCWDANQNTFVDTMVAATGEKGDKGDPGFSPTATVVKSGDTATITITDKRGTTTAEVTDGEDGISPVANVNKSGKKATITITDRTGTTEVEITDGEDGFSPSAAVSKSGDTAEISITDKNGTTTAQIKDGFAPTASVSKVGHTATITITDKNGTTSKQVSDGDTGATPVIGIGTVSKLQPGSNPTATMDVTDPEHPVLSLGLVTGDPGEVTEEELDELSTELKSHIDKVDNELLTHRMEFEQGGILSISNYSEYSTNTSGIRVHTIAKLSPPSVTIDPKGSGTSYQVAIFDSSGNLLGSDLTWKSDRYYLASNSIAEIRISIKKVVSGSDVSINPQTILNAGFTVSVDPDPYGNFREVTNALRGFTPSKIKVMGYNVGHYAYGTQNGYSGDDADDRIKLWKKFLAEYNVDICGLEEWQRYFDLNSTKDALAQMWTPLYKYHAGLISSLFSTFAIDRISTGYLGSSDPDTQRYYVKGYVTIHGKEICIMDVHLSPAVPDAVNVRANQINDLLAILANEKRFIVFGDFNVASTDEYNPFITAGYTLANGGYLGWMNTHNPQDSTKYFDNIIVSPNITVSNFEVLYNEYANLTSDHYPTIAELTVY